MENKTDIVAYLARNRVVELMVAKIAHQALSDDLKDLCQMVYIILLEYEEDKILDIWENGHMSFFIARIIINQFRSTTSPFHTIYRKYQERSCDVFSIDIIDESYED